jgi:hypothetical protein
VQVTKRKPQITSIQKNAVVTLSGFLSKMVAAPIEVAIDRLDVVGRDEGIPVVIDKFKRAMAQHYSQAGDQYQTLCDDPPA